MKKSHCAVFHLCLVLTLSGCVSASKNTCSDTNWELLGLGDGRSGHTLKRLEQHRRSCAEHKVVPDERAYFKGRDKGLLHYCQASHGYQQGIAGSSYKNVCPTKLEPMFIDAYRFGRKLYTLKQEITSLELKLAQAQETQRRFETDAQHNRFVINNKRNTEATRARLAEQLRSFDQAIQQFQLTIQKLRTSIRVRTDEFRKLKAYNPYR